MSHFVVYVVVPESNLSLSHEASQSVIAERLEPFNENTEVAPYKKRCWCVGKLAEREAGEKNRSGDRINAARTTLNAEFPFEADRTEEGEARRDARWKKLTGAIFAEEKALIDAHPMKDKPAADCSECGGSGEETTTYNPQSKWDWWAVGGRWSGTLGGIDPEKNPANWEDCDLCNATGTRSDAVGIINGFTARKWCNGCDGKGRKMKWPTRLVQEGNHAAVSTLLELPPEEFKKRTPFAVLLGDGTWAERGQMGWWAMVSDEKPKDDWCTEFRALLEKSRGHWLVAIDCHI